LATQGEDDFAHGWLATHFLWVKLPPISSWLHILFGRLLPPPHLLLSIPNPDGVLPPYHPPHGVTPALAHPHRFLLPFSLLSLTHWIWPYFVLTDKTRIHLRSASVRTYTFFTTGFPRFLSIRGARGLLALNQVLI
jgi:hypothetical protein